MINALSELVTRMAEEMSTEKIRTIQIHTNKSEQNHTLRMSEEIVESTS